MNKKHCISSSHTGGEIVLYRSADGMPALEVKLERDTVWLSQRHMSTLFEKDTDTIGLHIRNIFKEGELQEATTTEGSSVVQDEGGRKIRRRVKFYNLDVIISVGYRVKSKQGLIDIQLAQMAEYLSEKIMRHGLSKIRSRETGR